jgi:hypothetical protein
MIATVRKAKDGVVVAVVRPGKLSHVPKPSKAIPKALFLAMPPLSPYVV